jgi:hypothetical protein
MKIKPGQLYRDYKGGEYRVLTVATHTENQKKYVVYQAEYDGRVLVQPSSLFASSVKVNGNRVKRFEPIKEEN